VEPSAPTTPAVAQPDGLVGEPLQPANADEPFAEVGAGQNGGGAAGALGGGSPQPQPGFLGCSLGASQPSAGWPALLLLLALGAVPVLRRWA
ncbi:MAG: hypothetical protein KDD82_17330, partial [Planctomycetes bacterium]|nr:hypothetical protein [Planctomycetota bacterium]